MSHEVGGGEGGEEVEVEVEGEVGGVPVVPVVPVPGVKNESYLPAWILDMRKNLEKSKNASSQADKQINGLIRDVAGLTTKLNDATAETKLHQQVLDDRSDGKKVINGMNILDLPDDTLCIILQFLVVREVMNVESTRKEVRQMIESSNYWLASYFDQVKRFKSSGQTNFRNFIVNKEQCISSALTFIRVLKEKRSVPRFRNIEPHRYHRSESGVSHPFPIIEEHMNSNGQYSVSNTMMSRVETMNTDFRSFALLSMRDISELTSYESDVIHLKLVQQGAVAVLVSLLSSESDVLRQYSCESLANILCWETRLALNYERFSYLYFSHLIYSSHFVMNRSDGTPMPDTFQPNVPLSHKSLREQLQVCDARRQLSSLLTSPSACVNLAQSRERGQDVNAPINLQSINKMTSSVQGLSSKAACRVLINLFSSSDCVPSPLRNVVVFGKSDVKTKVNKLETHGDNVESSDTISSPTSLKKKTNNEVRSTPSCIGTRSTQQIVNNKSIAGGRGSRKQDGLLRSSSLSKKSAKPIGNTTKINHKDAKVSSAPGILPPKKESSIPVFQHKTITDISNCIPTEPWKFIYYHKSGFVKDTHVVWLQFLDERSGIGHQDQEIRGRGEDDTGLFFLKGHVNIDIEGFSWKIEKCYVKKPVASQESSRKLTVSNSMPIPSAADEEYNDSEILEISRDQWIRNATGEWISKEEISTWGRPHIVHTGYSSKPVTDAVVTEDFVRNQQVSALINLRNSHQAAPEQLFREDQTYYYSKDVTNDSNKGRSNLGGSISGDFASGVLTSKQRHDRKKYEDYIYFNTNWGGGMYGVWEVSSTESHFELVKGGVFRASPMGAC